MIVRCNQCGTEFGLDERQVGGEGMAVRCSICKNVFRVETSPPKAVPWQVQTTDGTRFSAPNLATLREWIEEGRLHPDDEVTRTGRSWVRLGGMPEFASAFEAFVDLPPMVKPVAPPRVEVGSSVRPIARDPSPKVPPISRRPDVMPPTPVRGTTSPELELEDDDKTIQRPAYRASQPSSSGLPSAWPVGDDDRTREMVRPAVAPPVVAAPVIAAPVVAAPVVAAPVQAPPPKPSQSEPAGFEPELESVDFEVVPRRRGIGPGLIAFLGVIAAVGVMFGVPSIRERLLGLGQSDPPSDPAAVEPTTVPEIAAAEAATQELGLAGLAKAEAALQRKLDAGEADPAISAAMKVALADLLLERALAYDIAAALDEGQREVYQTRARDDHEGGKRLVDSLGGAPDVDRLGEVRALARLAAGRDAVEVLPLVPEDARETELIVQGAVLWRDAAAPVPEGLVAGLQGLDSRSGLGEAVLALAFVRANDETAARNVLERLLVRADDQIVGVALRVRLGAAEIGDAAAETGETGETGEAEVLVAKAPPIPSDVTPASTSGSGGGGGGSSFEKLVERGCEAARNGSAETGINLLLDAYDGHSSDLDVLVCLGDGYIRQGQRRRAGDFYDKALGHSPKHKPALEGAAEVAAKSGETGRATTLYETLLTVDPGNPDAKAFLAKQQSSDTGGEQDPPPPPEPSEGG